MTPFLNVVAFIILLLGHGSAEDECKGNKESPYYKLKQEVFCDYDTDIRPVKNQSNSVQVNATFLPRYISMDEHENVLSVHTLIELIWMDEFIRWKPSDYGGVQSIVLESNAVWTPDFQLYNDRYYYGAKTDMYIPHVHSYYTGLMYALLESEMAAHCNMDIYKWPFDIHTCRATIGSQNFHGNQMDITLSKEKVKMSLFLNNTVWALDSVTATKITTMYPTSNITKTKYVRFEKQFVVRRFSSALFSTIIVPVLSCIFLTLVALLIDPQDSTRMVCILISLAGHVSFLQYLGDNLPANSSKGVLVITLLRDSLIITFVSFLVATINRHLQTLQSVPPVFVTALFRKLNTTGTVKFLLLPDEDKAASSEDEVSLVKTASKMKHEWVLLTSLIDRILLILFLIIYIILFTVYVST